MKNSRDITGLSVLNAHITTAPRRIPLPFGKVNLADRCRWALAYVLRYAGAHRPGGRPTRGGPGGWAANARPRERGGEQADAERGAGDSGEQADAEREAGDSGEQAIESTGDP